MANVIKIKRSAVEGRVPSTGDLDLGELAINTFDGLLFLKKSANSVEDIVTVAIGQPVRTDDSVTFANVALGNNGSIIFGDDSVQTGRAPRMFTAQEMAAEGYDVTYFVAGDTWYDEADGSTFIVISNDDEGNIQIQDLTVRA